MSGEMDPERLKMARGIADPNRSGRSHSPLMAELLAAHDHHYKRAEEAEAEAAQLLADLADMKRQRDDNARLVCDWAAQAGVADTPKDVAKKYGWPHLYPEETSK